MLEQLSGKSNDQKLQEMVDFLAHLAENLESAKDFKRQNPDRNDVNALIELNLAIQEEAKAVCDLVKIGEDCPEDWHDLEEARGSLTQTLARIGHHNWISLGPSNSRRFNQLLFHFKVNLDSKEGTILLSELREVSQRLVEEGLKPALKLRVESLAAILESGPGDEFLTDLHEQVQELENFMDLSLFDQSLDNREKCVVCYKELSLGASRCPNCGASVLTLEQTKMVESQQESARSQLLDSLWDSWNRFQCEEIEQENLQQIFHVISDRIQEAVENIDVPSEPLLDFSRKLAAFSQLPDRKALETKWPALIASGRALVNERLNQLKRPSYDSA
jgi:hypothetical protein